MTSARPGDGEEVHTTARLADGREVEGEAWFRTDPQARHIEWGSEGPNDYRGHLDIRPSADGSEVEVHLHTTRITEGDEVREGIEETLAAIRRHFG